MERRELLDRSLEAVGGNQAELARRLGRSETTVSRWMTDRNGIDFESALRLARLTALPAREVIEACGLDPALIPVGLPDALPGPDPDFAVVAATWPTLDDGIRRAIRILAGSQPPITGRGRGGITGQSRPGSRDKDGHTRRLTDEKTPRRHLVAAAA